MNTETHGFNEIFYCFKQKTWGGLGISVNQCRSVANLMKI